MLNFEKLCVDHNVPFRTRGKNCSPGWVNICCPNCSHDTGFHGGVCLEEEYYNCWKCGRTYLPETLHKILGFSKYECKLLLKEYSNKKIQEKKEVKRNSKLHLPKEADELSEIHKKYLLKRKYNPDYLEGIYQLKGTTYYGDYKFRIIAPIFLRGRLISFQGRDVTGKSELRYKACPKTLEVMDHKKSLYGIDLALEDKVIVVEGIFDAFRLGPGSVATFGIGYTREQLLLLKQFEKVYILFDNDDAAQHRAEQLAWALSALGTSVQVVSGISSDPGDLSQDDADYIKRELL